MRLACFILALLALCPTFADAPSERPDSFFHQDLDKLQSTTTPTHFILSGYLRKSMTFTIYPKVMSHCAIEGEFLPYELPLLAGGIDREALNRFLNTFRKNPFLQSVVVSDPYKQIIIDDLDELTDTAAEIKTVNLIYKADGKLIGDNIEARAFLSGAQAEIDFEYEGQSMLFFGCGGVSSAIACKLAPKLKRIGLVEVNEERKQKLAQLLKELYPSAQIIVFDRTGPLDFSDFDIFYNGTGLGKFSKNPDSINRSPIVEGDIFPAIGLAIDANYTPWQTLFLEQLAKRGFKTLNGYSHMLSGTAIHLSLLSRKKIDYSIIKNVINQSQNQTANR